MHFAQRSSRAMNLKSVIGLVTLMFIATLCLSAGSASAEEWHESKFCWGEQLGPNDSCYLPQTTDLHAVYGQGQQHSVCVRGVLKKAETEMCSGGPAPQSVYNAKFSGTSVNWPEIVNNGGSKNQVYGRFWWTFHSEGGGGGGGGEGPPPTPSWHSENFGGTSPSAPEICSWGDGHVEIFHRGTDNALWHKYWNGTSWSGWESLGGSLASGPGCVSWGANRVDVVARASNNTLLHWYWNGSSWNSENLGGSIVDDPDIASWGVNRLDIFGRGSNGSIQHKAFTGSGWTGWESVTGANAIVSGVGAVGSGGSRIDVVGRASNNSVFHLYYSNGNWYTENFGGIAQGDPDMSSWGAGTYDVWMRGTDNGLWHKWWKGSTWSDWEFTGEYGIYASPGAVSFEPLRHDVVTLNSDGSIRHLYWK